MKTTLYILSILALLGIQACGEKKPQPVETKPQLPIVKVEEPVAKPEPVVQQPVYRFYVIAGCFKVEDNAIRLTQKLNKDGHSALMIPFSRNRNLVSFGGYTSYNEAQKALNSITYQDKLKGLWIYETED
ncbi:MAG: SPOR domain-containing protein [Marinifilaceae bacterium]